MPGIDQTPYQNTEERRIEIYRAMSGEQKLQISLELYRFAQVIVKASIIELYPEISDSDLKREVIKRFSR
jgi:hypothetical protein